MSTFDVLFEHQRTAYPANKYEPGETVRVACLCGWSAPAPARGDGRRLFARHQAHALAGVPHAHPPIPIPTTVPERTAARFTGPTITPEETP